jgi:hypothetical protein
LIDGIVHRRDQVFDIASVKGGDERFSQRGHDLTRYLICFVLASRYLLATAQHIVISLQQGPERLSGSKRYPSMASEEVEESLLFRHQSPKPAQHERASLANLNQGDSRGAKDEKSLSALIRFWEGWAMPKAYSGEMRKRVIAAGRKWSFASRGG